MVEQNDLEFTHQCLRLMRAFIQISDRNLRLSVIEHAETCEVGKTEPYTNGQQSSDSDQANICWIVFPIGHELTTHLNATLIRR